MMGNRRGGWNPEFEGRNPKAETRKKAEIRNPKAEGKGSQEYLDREIRQEN
jgi:hypothetical protein